MSSQLSLTAVSLAVLCVCQGVWAQDAADGTLGTVSVEAPATPFRQLLGVEVTGTAIVNPKARERLASGCRLDLDPTAFAPGRAAVTLIAQIPVMLACTDDGWLLMAPSSMAGHFEGWLHHALG